MRAIALALLVLAPLAATGCQPQAAQPVPVAPTWQDAKDGLVVQLSVPQRVYIGGETIPVTVTARNATDRDIAITADSQAKVIVTIARQTAAGWEEVKRYPGAAAMIKTVWTLRGGAAHPFGIVLNLKVAPDWPTAEPLKLTAWLNGRPDVHPNGTIQIFATRKESERTKVSFGPEP